LRRDPFTASRLIHQALPFVETSPKAKLAGSIETQPGSHLTALTAFRIVAVAIMTARNKNVRSRGVVFGCHCHKIGLDIAYRRSESFQCLLKACRAYNCSDEGYLFWGVKRPVKFPSYGLDGR
jgi:hypothetical protein